MYRLYITHYTVHYVIALYCTIILYVHTCVIHPFRVTAATKMNDVSSRSHAIFTILFNQVRLSLMDHEIISTVIRFLCFQG